MMKFWLTLMSAVALQSAAMACEMPMDDLVAPDELEVTDVSAGVVCYARDRFGNIYSGTHPHSRKAQEKALRQCEAASRALCFEAGCRNPQPGPHPGHPHRRRLPGRRGD